MDSNKKRLVLAFSSPLKSFKVNNFKNEHIAVNKVAHILYISRNERNGNGNHIRTSICIGLFISFTVLLVIFVATASIDGRHFVIA